MKISLSERILLTKYHKLENKNKELENKLSEYRESFETMKDYITELKGINKVLVNQISNLSLQIKSWVN